MFAHIALVGCLTSNVEFLTARSTRNGLVRVCPLFVEDA
jgi:hypothetical protein